MIEVVRKLLVRHGRAGLLIDTNLLLLYFIGRFAPDLITRFKRTDVFVPDDFKLLQLIVKKFPKLWTTPAILAEVNSFSRQLGEPLRTEYFKKFRTEISLLDEKYVPSVNAAGEKTFEKFGLTDAGIMMLARTPYLVLTGDFPLYRYLDSHGIDVINFNQLRPYGWSWLISGSTRV